VQPVGRSGPRRLTRSPADEFGPAYSPNGRQIAFYRRSGDYAAVYQVSPSGKPTQRLFGLAFGPPGPDSAESGGWNPETLSWSPDGKFLAVVDRNSPNGPLRIFLRDIAAQRFHAFSFPPPSSLGDGNPAFSPDGQYLAFVGRTAPHRGDVYVGALAGEGARRLTACDGNVRGLAWTSDARRIIFSSDHSGEPRLWSISVSGGSPEPVAGVSDGAVFPTVAAGGGRLAFASLSDLGYVVRLELSTSSPSLSRPQRLIPFPASTPQISPDGRRIAFTSAHSGRSEIWASDAQGLNPIRLASMPTLAGSPRWSPDGSQIAFDSLLPTGWDVYVISSKGGEPRRVTWHEGSDVRPSWSRDGQWLYFGSDRGGTMQIWKMPVTGGAEHQVTFQGGYDAVESPDGKFLFYTRRGLPGLWTVPVDGGEEKLLLRELQWQNSRNWAVREDGIYFLFCEGLLPAERQCFVRRHRFNTGAVDTVLRLGNVSLKNAGCSLSPGGESLLVVQRAAAETDIAMVKNWR
jgi:Tol biopolymer transport system component